MHHLDRSSIYLLSPFFMAAFPIIFLAAENRHEGISVLEILTPFLLVQLVVAVMMAVALLILRDLAKAAVLSSVFIGVFFGFGPVLEFVRDSPFVWVINRQYIVPGTIAGSLVLIVTSLGVAKLRVKWQGPLQLTTILFAGLILFNIGRILADPSITFSPSSTDDQTATKVAPIAQDGELPDIYHFVLDGYPRADVLAEVYQFDNKDFINQLTQLGFSVQKSSVANYNWTSLSIPTTLNMRYIQPDDPRRTFWQQQSLIWREQTQEVLESTAAGRFAEGQGYRVIGVNTADFDLTSRSVLFSPFSLIIFRLTPIGQNIGKIHDYLQGFWARNARNRLFHMKMAQVVDIADDPRATMTFIYGALPHPPFIFEQDGSIKRGSDAILDVFGWGDRQPVIDQIIFTNRVVIEVVRQILERSDRDPVIFIHADHGSRSRPFPEALSKNPPRDVVFEQTGILAAFHLPESCDQELPEQMTPVNYYRFIYNSCLNAEMELLPDRSYFLDLAGRGFVDVFPNDSGAR